jgi:2C-methyl-D-erythritol 2,4-cyclodiphosphate synthase
MTPDITTYIMAVLAAILGALGLYTRGQHYKIKTLDAEVKAANGRVAAANKVAKISKAKADLHKDVAKTVVQNSSIAKEKVKQIQEKIDEIKDGEDFTLVV